MNEELKTIKELADEWGISKQAVLKRIQKLPSDKKPQKVNGKYFISIEIKKEMESENNQDTTGKSALILLLIKLCNGTSFCV